MRFDVVVIGAGPAGLAAATTVAAHGFTVALLDAAPRPGGQFWRHRDGDTGEGHRDWATFVKLREQLSEVDYRPNTKVWFVEPGHTIHTDSGEFEADRLVIATGAYDRTVPFPGWDLPGVFTAGGAQALLKGQGVAVGRRVVVAGTGPFLLPVAAGLAHAGVEVAGVFETASPLGYLRALPPLGKVAEAGGYLAKFARHRIRYRTGRAVVAAHGEDRLTAVTVMHRGKAHRVECDALAIGYGFTPQVELAIAAGCATSLDADGSLTIDVDRAQTTSVAGVFAAGEVTGIGGAELALIEGRLAGLAAVGVPAPTRLLRRREVLQRFAAVLARVHPVPAQWASWCADDTVLCRCERVPVGALHRAVQELGVVDGRGAKLMTRVGMGWCQGRVCGYAASCLVAQGNERPVAKGDLLGFATRPIAQPVTLGDLAGARRVSVPPD